MLKKFSALTRGQRIFLLIWSLCLLTLGIGAGNSIIKLERKNLDASIRKHRDRIDPNFTESGKTEPERTPPVGHENDVPLDVKVGVYIDRIPALSVARPKRPAIATPVPSGRSAHAAPMLGGRLHRGPPHLLRFPRSLLGRRNRLPWRRR